MRWGVWWDAADPAGLAAALVAGPDDIVVRAAAGPVEPSADASQALAAFQERGGRLFAEIGPLGGSDPAPLVESLLTWAPDGLVLRAAVGKRDVQRLGAILAVAEARRGRPDGGTAIVAAAADAAAGALALASLPGCSPRLAGLFWDAGALADGLGCDRAAEPVRHARSGLLLAAAAAGVPAYACLSAGDPLPAGRDGFAGFWTRDLALMPSAGLRTPAGESAGAGLRPALDA